MYTYIKIRTLNTHRYICIDVLKYICIYIYIGNVHRSKKKCIKLDYEFSASPSTNTCVWFFFLIANGGGQWSWKNNRFQCQCRYWLVPIVTNWMKLICVYSSRTEWMYSHELIGLQPMEDSTLRQKLCNVDWNVLSGTKYVVTNQKCIFKNSQTKCFHELIGLQRMEGWDVTLKFGKARFVYIVTNWKHISSRTDRIAANGGGNVTLEIIKTHQQDTDLLRELLFLVYLLSRTFIRVYIVTNSTQNASTRQRFVAWAVVSAIYLDMYSHE